MDIIKTDASNTDFVSLVKMLDKDLAVRDGADHGFYDQFNKIENIKYALVGYFENRPVSCGAMKIFNEETMEVKRMYVREEHRGKGYASSILLELEKWADELGYKYSILETGKRQPEAISLYKKNGYRQIQNYDQYIGIDNSVCFRKTLI